MFISSLLPSFSHASRRLVSASLMSVSRCTQHCMLKILSSGRCGLPAHETCLDDSVQSQASAETRACDRHMQRRSCVMHWPPSTSFFQVRRTRETGVAVPTPAGVGDGRRQGRQNVGVALHHIVITPLHHSPSDAASFPLPRAASFPSPRLTPPLLPAAPGDSCPATPS